MTRPATGVAAAAIAAALLPLVSGAGSARPDADRDGDIVISIPGVPGPYCVYGIEKRLGDLRGIERVELRWDEEEIRVLASAASPATADDVRRAVERSEYPYPYSVRPHGPAQP